VWKWKQIIRFGNDCAKHTKYMALVLKGLKQQQVVTTSYNVNIQNHRAI